MLILGGFYRFRGDLVALDLPDDGQCVDIAAAGAGQIRPQIDDLLPFLLAHIGIFLFIHWDTSSSLYGVLKKGKYSPLKALWICRIITPVMI